MLNYAVVQCDDRFFLISKHRGEIVYKNDFTGEWEFFDRKKYCETFTTDDELSAHREYYERRMRELYLYGDENFKIYKKKLDAIINIVDKSEELIKAKAYEKIYMEMIEKCRTDDELDDSIWDFVQLIIDNKEHLKNFDDSLIDQPDENDNHLIRIQARRIAKNILDYSSDLMSSLGLSIYGMSKMYKAADILAKIIKSNKKDKYLENQYNEYLNEFIYSLLAGEKI